MTLNNIQGQTKDNPINATFVNAAFVHDENAADTVIRRKSGNANSLQLDGSGNGPGNNNNHNNSNNNNVMPASQPSIDFDDLLPLIGEFGKYQKILFLCMIPFAFFVAFVYFSQIFLTLVPEQHWCTVPELEGLPIEER